MKRERHDDEDRLSDLSEYVLLRILSFLTAKQAVQTCIVSKRWKNLWKLLPTLRLSCSHFRTFNGFNQFTTKVLSLRDHSTALYYLRFSTEDIVKPQLLQSILNSAVSQNLQRLRIFLCYHTIRIPDCIFSCHTLTSLKLYVRHCTQTPLFPNSLNLPALTNLTLSRFVFCSDNDGRAEPFSALEKLNSLTIQFCKVLDGEILSISSATLTKLTIQTTMHEQNYGKIELSTPNLSTFAYGGIPFEKICGSHLFSVKHVIIDAYMLVINAEPPSNLLSLLKEFTEITSLTVTLTTLEVLSLVPNLLKVNFHSLHNLETLRVKKLGISSGTYDPIVDGKFVPLSSIYLQNDSARFRKAIVKEGSLAIPDDIIVFLLQNSTSAKVTSF